MEGLYTGFAVVAAGLAGVLLGAVLGWAAGWAQRIEEYNAGFDAGAAAMDEELLKLEIDNRALERELKIVNGSSVVLDGRLGERHAKQVCGSYETESKTEIKEENGVRRAVFENKRKHNIGTWRVSHQRKAST